MLEDSYNDFLLTKLQHLFPKDIQAFLEASETQRPTIIRTNTLKTRRKDLAKLLIARGMDVEPLDICPSSLTVYSSRVPVGATPEYLTGLYTIQGASSLLPVLSLNIECNQTILDMCAAPGGKTSHICALLENSGMVYAYDNDRHRLQALQSNIARLGINNCIAICKDARKIINSFDRILLDAPCSGTGIISKDPSVKVSRTEADLRKTVKMQKQLLKKAFQMLRVNGILVYSTCSVLREENEDVVENLIRKNKNARIVEGLSVGKDGFVNFRGDHYHPTMKMCRRVYPHSNNMDGFFVAKITKIN